jgi:hypothetical protein
VRRALVDERLGRGRAASVFRRERRRWELHHRQRAGRPTDDSRLAGTLRLDHDERSTSSPGATTTVDLSYTGSEKTGTKAQEGHGPEGTLAFFSRQ